MANWPENWGETMLSRIVDYCGGLISGKSQKADGCAAGESGTVCGVNGPCKTLNEAPEGTIWKVRCLTCQGAVRQRLLDIGFIPGARITLIRSAPLLDPIEVGVGSGYVALRRSEAAGVHVTSV